MKKISEIKNEFAILNDDVVYLDSAATSQKPQCVLDAMQNYYKTVNANPNRAAYKLGVLATEAYQAAREKVANFLGTKNSEEIIFTKNATESLNLIAYSYGLNNLKRGDEVVLSIMEHHSNLVPWQQISKAKGAKLKYLYLNDNFEIDEREIEEKITPKTKVVCVLSTSNVLGTKNDIEKIAKKAHSVGAIVIADITQSVAHEKFDVQKTDVDFAAFSAHKMYGPMGIGVLYGKKSLLEKMNPFLMGGDMIEYVYEQSTTFASLPNKFEAGTQNVAGAIGLARAIDFVNEIGYKNIEKHDRELYLYAKKSLGKLPYVEIYAPKNCTSSVLSFNVKGLHPHDVASLLDAEKICVRAGNHCAQPLLRFLKVDGTVRISFGVYNTKEDIDRLVSALEKAYKKFSKYIKE